VYHHVSEAHLHRYLGEFDFRYNQRVALGASDDQRMVKAGSGIIGKRLTYRWTRRHEETSFSRRPVAYPTAGAYRTLRFSRV